MQNPVQIGKGKFLYSVIENWEQLPPGYDWSETAGVSTDAEDNVYVFNRGKHPMMIFNSAGEFLDSWGEDVFVRPHGVSKGPNNTIYCTDDGDHTVRQCTLDGKILMTIGNPGNASDAFSGNPFNRCTHTATDPSNGDIFVTDGYGNSRIHKYTDKGKLIKSWGEPGAGEGEFNIVHNIATDKDGYLYVCDRENHRIQVFNRNGDFETLWANVHRPCAIFIDQNELVYVAELGFGTLISKSVPNIGPRVTVLNKQGQVLQRIGDLGYGLKPGQFIAPHGLCLDSDSNIYIAEVARTAMSHHGEPPKQLRSFQKLQKV